MIIGQHSNVIHKPTVRARALKAIALMREASGIIKSLYNDALETSDMVADALMDITLPGFNEPDFDEENEREISYVTEVLAEIRELEDEDEEDSE